MYMNRITLIGFTGQDAKPAATQTGKEVTRFSLATTNAINKIQNGGRRRTGTIASFMVATLLLRQS